MVKFLGPCFFKKCPYWPISEAAYFSKLGPDTPGIFIDQNCLWLLGAALNDFFFKNVFHQKEYKHAVKIGVVQIRFAIYKFDIVKKCSISLLDLPSVSIKTPVYSLLDKNIKNSSSFFSIPFSCLDEKYIVMLNQTVVFSDTKSIEFGKVFEKLLMLVNKVCKKITVL